MDSKSPVINRTILALLVTGSAILFCACSGAGRSQDEDVNEGLMTLQADTLQRTESKNGRKSTMFRTPLMEEYRFAKEPYREYRKGVYAETYDSVGMIESTLVADYAIERINLELWEGKGNVVVTNAQGQKLETQQLFWNRRIGKIYSNVDSKITTEDGEEHIGDSFESDEKFKEWEFRRARGIVGVDIEPNDEGREEEDEDNEEGESAGGVNDLREKVDNTEPDNASVGTENGPYGSGNDQEDNVSPATRTDTSGDTSETDASEGGGQ